MKLWKLSFLLLLLLGVGLPFGTASCKKKICSDSCIFNHDGQCDDGGEGSEYNMCEFGTDCADCGEREHE